jgi:hypothetical protein
MLAGQKLVNPDGQACGIISLNTFTGEHMSLIFTAIPTAGTVENGQLTPKFLKMLADLHTKFPEHTFIAPMVQDYQILKFMSVTATWGDWGKTRRTIIARCDEVWVLKFSGWDSSVGVAGEIECAREHGKILKFLDTEEAQLLESKFYNRQSQGCFFTDDDTKGMYRVFTAFGNFLCVTDWEGGSKCL